MLEWINKHVYCFSKHLSQAIETNNFITSTQTYPIRVINYSFGLNAERLEVFIIRVIHGQ